jgi:SPP1 gp7 family putative phage head morphogenesis protein
LAKHLSAPRAAEEAYVRGLVEVFREAHRATFGARFDAKKVPVPQLFDGMAKKVVDANKKVTLKALGLLRDPAKVKLAVFAAREASIRLVENALRDYSGAVRAVFSAPENFGLSVDALKEKLLAQAKISEARAELIARDQVLKLNGAINQARQEAAGVDRYTWSTVGDDRVRPTHVSKEGRVFSWADPPADTGHPGQDYQCRCVAIALL